MKNTSLFYTIFLFTVQFLKNVITGNDVPLFLAYGKKLELDQEALLRKISLNVSLPTL